MTSDCWAIRDFHEHHHVTDTAPESAALALKNGCDVNCGNTYLHMLTAYQEGLVTEEDITTACERMYTSRYLLGCFADDCEYDKIPYTANDTDENDALALEAAEKCMVLLRNDGVLPLDAGKIRTIAVVGPNADSVPALEGNYNGRSSRRSSKASALMRRSTASACCSAKAATCSKTACRIWVSRTTAWRKPNWLRKMRML